MWWPVLTALSTLAADRRLDVRLAALEALFDALESHGKKFSSGLWGLIFKGVLIPLLDELRHLEVVVEKGAHMLPKLPLPPTRNPSTRMPPYAAGKTTATLCLERLLECFGQFYDIVGFLPEVLFLLGKCMDAGDAEEQLAAASARALEVMLVAHGHKFPEDVWGLIADELRNVMKRAEPTWVFFALPPEDEVENMPVPESEEERTESPSKKALSLPPPRSPTAHSGAAAMLTSPRQPSFLNYYRRRGGSSASAIANAPGGVAGVAASSGQRAGQPSEGAFVAERWARPVTAIVPARELPRAAESFAAGSAGQAAVPPRAVHSSRSQRRQQRNCADRGTRRGSQVHGTVGEGDAGGISGVDGCSSDPYRRNTSPCRCAPARRELHTAARCDAQGAGRVRQRRAAAPHAVALSAPDGPRESTERRGAGSAVQRLQQGRAAATAAHVGRRPR
ncbi:hypothetical protein ON010_g5092 [Phytophthora cinnamomi]|nr:hypothetical protein ON010_g5092 [Phytophthora cinnamomi]